MPSLSFRLSLASRPVDFRLRRPTLDGRRPLKSYCFLHHLNTHVLILPRTTSPIQTDRLQRYSSPARPNGENVEGGVHPGSPSRCRRPPPHVASSWCSGCCSRLGTLGQPLCLLTFTSHVGLLTLCTRTRVSFISPLRRHSRRVRRRQPLTTSPPHALYLPT